VAVLAKIGEKWLENDKSHLRQAQVEWRKRRLNLKGKEDGTMADEVLVATCLGGYEKSDSELQ
jgi:hypothetical protein